MPKQLKIEYYEENKWFNAKVSPYDGFDSQVQSETGRMAQDAKGCYFDNMRILYYGDDWLRLLFQTLFINSRGHDGKS